MKVKLVLKTILAYLLWIIALLLGIWFGIIGQHAFQIFLGSLEQTNQHFEFQKMMILLDRVFSILIWLVWLMMMVITEEAFRRAAQKGNLFRRFAWFVGPLLLLILAADVYLLSVQGFLAAGPERWLLLAAELVSGIVLTLYGWLFGRTRRARVLPGATP